MGINVNGHKGSYLGGEKFPKLIYGDGFNTE